MIELKKSLAHSNIFINEVYKNDHEQLQYKYSSCCPAFLIYYYLTGPYVGIAGAMYSEQASFNPFPPSNIYFSSLIIIIILS